MQPFHLAFAPGPAPQPGPRSQPSREPILNLPPMVAALLLVNISIHLVRLLLPADLDVAIVLTFGFVPIRYSGLVPFDWPVLVAPVTYQFLHSGAVHIIANMAMLMAFGAGVERRIGPRRFLAFTLLCGVLAIVAHFAIFWDSTAPVIGASGAISGLFGGVLRFMPRLGGWRRLAPLVSLWIGVSVLFGISGLPGAEEIAWVAHIGGFAVGLLLFPVFDRPSRARPNA